jgi:hypothetical protein
MTECKEQRWLFQDLGERKVELDFGGGYLSSDGGGLILRELEHHSGLLRDFAGCFVDYRDQRYVEHSVQEYEPAPVNGGTAGLLRALRCVGDMTPGAEEFRCRLQTELGLTISPKDPILAEWLAHEEFKEELAAEHQRMLVAFEEALRKNEALWIESAKNLANQSLNAALRAARESTAALIEEAGRSQAAAVRAALERGVERLEKAAVRLARLSWATFAAAVIALVAAVMLIAQRFLH